MIWELIVFAALMVGTPGPANMVLITAGAHFGLHACMRFIIGIIAGKFLLNLVIALGFYEMLRAMPVLFDLLTYISAAFMIWLSFSMIRPFREIGALHHAPGLVKGLMVHPMNPKAWAMLTIAWSGHGPDFDDPWMRFITIAGVFMGAQLIFHSLWCYAGARLIALLPSEQSRYLAGVILTGLTIGVVCWIVFI